MCCDCHICVDYSFEIFSHPVVLCVPNRVRASSQLTWDSLQPYPSIVKEPLTQVTLEITRHTNLTTWRWSRPLSYADRQDLRQIFKIMATRPSYQMGLPHQMVWGLVGTSYWGDPLNVSGFNIVNIFGARRRAASFIWLLLTSQDWTWNSISSPLLHPSHHPPVRKSSQIDPRHTTSSICIKEAKIHSHKGYCIINGRSSSYHTWRSGRIYWR